MFRKTILSAVAATVLATSGFTSTSAWATDGGKEVAPVSRITGKDVAAGVAFGAAALILGAIAIDSLDDNRKSRKQHRRQVVSHDEVECFDKPVLKFSRKHGRKVFFSFKRVCH